jgi:ATP-binding cassette, subfamily B, bacterial
MLVFVAFLTQLYSPVRELSSLSNTVFKALAGAERVIELLDEGPRITERSGATDLGRAGGVVELDNVTFRYSDREEPALRCVSLRAEPGETLVLAGASGAGKSTVARLLLRFYDPAAGHVRIDGHDLRDLTLTSLRSNVAILLQDAPILHGTVRENIAFGRPGATDEQVAAAAEAAGASGFIADLPDGYETDLGSRGFRLSGGQQQRIAIARALVADAPVLVLDEPSTGLDQHTKAALLPALRRLMRERTTIVISHDLLTARDADAIVVLDQGQVVEQGRHQDLLARDGAYSRLWSAHADPAAAFRDGAVA